MPDTPVPRGEFQQYCKAVNGELHDIKEAVHDIQQKVDRNLIGVQEMFRDYTEHTISKACAIYITAISALATGVVAALVTHLLSSH